MTETDFDIDAEIAHVTSVLEQVRDRADQIDPLSVEYALLGLVIDPLECYLGALKNQGSCIECGTYHKFSEDCIYHYDDPDDL